MRKILLQSSRYHLMASLLKQHRIYLIRWKSSLLLELWSFTVALSFFIHSHPFATTSCIDHFFVFSYLYVTVSRSSHLLPKMRRIKSKSLHVVPIGAKTNQVHYIPNNVGLLHVINPEIKQNHLGTNHKLCCKSQYAVASGFTFVARKTRIDVRH